MVIKLPQNPWAQRGEISLELPDEWEVHIKDIAGSKCKPLEPEEIRKAVKNPVSGPPLRELAKGKGEVVIIFDDTSRITPVKAIVPWIIEELEAGGIKEENIRFIAALGCHGTMNRMDFQNKLGEEVLRRFPVYNHNPFGNCRFVGTTRTGTHLFVNEEVMRCDLKVAIGSVVPHIMTGFGGGGKIILPGVSSFDCVREFHQKGKERLKGKGGPFGILELLKDNPLRMDMEDAVRLVNLDFKVEVLVNSKGEAVEIFSGFPEKAYEKAIQRAIVHYRGEPVKGASIVISNVFSKANEGEIGVITTIPLLKEDGGDIVLIWSVPEGHVNHYLMGTFGRWNDPPLPLRINLPSNLRHLLVFSPYPELSFKDYFVQKERIIFFEKWEDLLSFLKKRHPSGSKVVVYPSADIHYFN